MHKVVNGITVELTQQEIDEFNAREEEYKAAQKAYEPIAYRDRRKDKYNARGVTDEAMNVAIWEKVIENRPEEADRLQVIRLQVKAEEPKPS